MRSARELKDAAAAATRVAAAAGSTRRPSKDASTTSKLPKHGADGEHSRPSSRSKSGASKALGGDAKGDEESSISGAFFDAASDDPVRDSPHDFRDLDERERADPTALRQRDERRQRLMNVVWLALGAAVVLVGVGVWRSKTTEPEVPSPSASAIHPKATTPPVTSGPRAADAPPALPTAAAAPASAAASASASAAPSASVAPPPASDEKPLDPAELKKLKARANGLLEAGKYKDAIEASKLLVDADPADASGYLFWGTALMSTGKNAEAREIFGACVDKATKGPIYDCRPFAPPRKK